MNEEKFLCLCLKIGFIMILIGLAVIALSSCAGNEHTETVTDLEKNLIYKSEIKQTLFLYFTKTKAIDHRTDYSSLTVGEVEQVPDSNSIEAVADITGNVILKAVMP